MVKDTPLIVIDPFGTRYFLNLFDNLKLICQDLPTKLIVFTDAVVSTWPWTKCPEIRSPYFKGFSRLIISPFFDDLKIVLFNVSLEI